MAPPKKKQKTDNENRQFTQGPLDELFGQRSAFPVNTNVKNIKQYIKSGEPPSNVETYLGMVRYEAENGGVFAFVEREGKEEEQHLEKDSVKPYHKTDLEVQNSDAKGEEKASWETEYLELYKQQKMDLFRGEMGGAENAKEAKRIPPKNAMKKWILDSANVPTPALLRSISHETVFLLIRQCTELITAPTDFPVPLSVWIHSLLLRAPEVLTGDDVSVLRELAKKFIRVRGDDAGGDPDDDPDDPFGASCSCVCAVVGKLYGQADLQIMHGGV